MARYPYPDSGAALPGTPATVLPEEESPNLYDAITAHNRLLAQQKATDPVHMAAMRGALAVGEASVRGASGVAQSSRPSAGGMARLALEGLRETGGPVRLGTSRRSKKPL